MPRDSIASQSAVSRILSAFVRLCALRRFSGLRRDDHSSSPVITDGIKQPTRRRRTGRPLITSLALGVVSPYLALLRAGFCLPSVLPRTRCALTAPFHHCTSREARPETRPTTVAVCFLCHCPSSCPDRALPGALPCGVRTFLPSIRLRALSNGDRL